MSSRSPKNIARIESPSIDLFGWQVRVQRRGTKHTRFFSDREYGSPDAALSEAESFRDELIQQLPASESDPAKAALAKNKSGVKGLWVAGKGNGRLYVQVGLRDAAGKLHSRSFPVEPDNIRKALWPAVTALQKIQRDTGAEQLEPMAMYEAAYRYVFKRVWADAD